MRYKVEFEMQLDAHESTSALVLRSLISAFGQIEGFKIAQSGGTYIGYLQGNSPIIWSEVHETSVHYREPHNH